MTLIEHLNRLDEFNKEFRKLAASENIVVQRFIDMYARGLIETKEKTLEMMVVALANSERNYREELIRLHTTLSPFLR